MRAWWFPWSDRDAKTSSRLRFYVIFGPFGDDDLRVPLTSDSLANGADVRQHGSALIVCYRKSLLCRSKRTQLLVCEWRYWGTACDHIQQLCFVPMDSVCIKALRKLMVVQSVHSDRAMLRCYKTYCIFSPVALLCALHAWALSKFSPFSERCCTGPDAKLYDGFLSCSWIQCDWRQYHKSPGGTDKKN